MESKKLPPVYRGIGNVDDVLHYATNLPESEGSIARELEQLHNVLSTLLALPTASPSALAIICAHLNIPFRATGRLFSVSSVGTVRTDYYSTDQERETIADLANLP